MYRHTGKLYNYNNKMHEAHEHYKSSSIWSFSLDSGDTSVLSFSVGCSSRCDCLATDSSLECDRVSDSSGDSNVGSEA